VNVFDAVAYVFRSLLLDVVYILWHVSRKLGVLSDKVKHRDEDGRWNADDSDTISH
jgi:hypothetical protein